MRARPSKVHGVRTRQFDEESRYKSKSNGMQDSVGEGGGEGG